MPPSVVAVARMTTTVVVENVGRVYAGKGNVSVCCLGDTRNGEKRKFSLPISFAIIDG